MDSWHRQFAPPPSSRRGLKAAQPSQPVRANKAASSQIAPKPVVKAKLATIDIKTVDPSFSKANGVTTSDLSVCGKRVNELLVGRVHGLYIAQLEKIYMKKFNELLPENWTDKLEAAGELIVVKEDGGLVLVKCGKGGKAPPTTVSEDSATSTAATSNLVEDNSNLKDRVMQLLKGRVHGLLVTQVEKMYLRQWGEKLKVEWVAELEKLGGVLVDRDGGEQIVLKLGKNGFSNQSIASKSLLELTTGSVHVNTVASSSVGTEVVGKLGLMGRVKDVLESRVHGLYTTQVEKLYEKKFLSTLPSTWWSDLVDAGKVEVESLESGRVVVKWNKS